MHVGDGFAELQDEADGGLGTGGGGCGEIIADGVDAAAVDVLHDDVRDAFVDAAVQQARDVGVLKLG